jgi:hypothetical protein
MRPYTILLAIIIFFLCTGRASSGTRDPDTPDSQYVEFGKKFPWVMKIRAVVQKAHRPVDDPNTEIVHYASAVVIRPHWVLTAAHVVAHTENQSILRESGNHALTKVLQHPEYKDELYGYHDLALCYSPKDFELEFYTPLFTDSDELGKDATIAGFGWHGTFHTGGKQYDSHKRAGSNKISALERNIMVCNASRGAERTGLEFLICPGDSGGGLFIGNRLAGINSFLMALDKKPDGTYTDEAAFTRVSLYADWVESEIIKAEAAQESK